MKRFLIALSMLLTSAVAFGDNAPAPDYSRDTILKILHDSDEVQKPFKIDIGMATLRTKNFNYKFAYLPLLAPLPYSGPHGAGQLPNPFVLTRTEYAWQPHQYSAEPIDYDRPRAVQREYRRIEKMLQKQHIVASR